MDSAQLVGIWVGAILTLFMFSFLYRENRFYRFTEHVFIGVGTGYTIVTCFKTFISTGWTPLIKGEYLSVIAIILGLLMLTRYYPKTRWLTRYPIAVLLGTSTALAIRGTVEAQIVRQIQATALPLVSPNPLTMFNNIVVVVMILATMSYFFFTVEHKGALGVASKMGRYSMMVMFGALFGGTIMTRMALLIGVLQFLLKDWLGLI